MKRNSFGADSLDIIHLRTFLLEGNTDAMPHTFQIHGVVTEELATGKHGWIGVAGRSAWDGAATVATRYSDYHTSQFSGRDSHEYVENDDFATHH